MSYTKSEAKCDWCSRRIYDGGDIACRDCHENLESSLADAEKLIQDLRARIALLEQERDMADAADAGTD